VINNGPTFIGFLNTATRILKYSMHQTVTVYSETAELHNTININKNGCTYSVIGIATLSLPKSTKLQLKNTASGNLNITKSSSIKKRIGFEKFRTGNNLHTVVNT